jgi:hypothetical protein
VRGYADSGELNDALELAEEQLLACYQKYRAQGLLPSTEVLRAAILPEQVVAEPPTKPATGFWFYFDEWIALTRSQSKPRSAQVYATAARHLREFGQISKYAIDFDTITLTFGDRYATHLLHTVKLTDNTVAKQILTLKRFLRWARDRGYTDATGFDRLSWKRQEPDIMTLTVGGGRGAGATGITGRRLSRQCAPAVPAGLLYGPALLRLGKHQGRAPPGAGTAHDYPENPRDGNNTVAG